MDIKKYANPSSLAYATSCKNDKRFAQPNDPTIEPERDNGAKCIVHLVDFLSKI